MDVGKANHQLGGPRQLGGLKGAFALALQRKCNVWQRRALIMCFTMYDATQDTGPEETKGLDAEALRGAMGLTVQLAVGQPAADSGQWSCEGGSDVSTEAALDLACWLRQEAPQHEALLTSIGLWCWRSPGQSGMLMRNVGKMGKV